MRTIISSERRRRFQDSGMSLPSTYARCERAVHVSKALYQQGTTSWMLIELANYHSDLDATTIRSHLGVEGVCILSSSWSASWPLWLINLVD